MHAEHTELAQLPSQLTRETRGFVPGVDVRPDPRIHERPDPVPQLELFGREQAIHVQVIDRHGGDLVIGLGHRKQGSSIFDGSS